FSSDRDLSANAFYMPWGGTDNRSGNVSGIGFPPERLLPSMFFGSGGLPQFGVNTPLPHSAPNAASSPFYKSPYFPLLALFGIPPGTLGFFTHNAYQGALGV